MDYLNTILDEDTIDNIIDTYDSKLLSLLDVNNINAIINYLKQNNIDFIEDILSNHTDLFVIEYSEFIRKFETLKQKYGQNFCHNLAYKLDILDSIWEL